MDMIKSLKSHPLLKGYRGKEGIDIEEFANVLVKVSALLDAAPEIREMDINPLIGTKKGIYAVDTRIRIEK
jgi:acetyltransferase